MASNRYIRAEYRLYDVTDDARDFLEETRPEQPFVFISGMGLLLTSFEKQLEPLEKGAAFRFTLTPEEAYGNYNEQMLQVLDKEFFYVNGKFDAENVCVNAIVPLENEEGQQFLGRVESISGSKVVVDLNHPLAGRTLRFEGKVLENHEATAQEIQALVEQLSGRRNGCHCGGDCDGDCKGKGEHHCDGRGEHHCDGKGRGKGCDHHK